MIITGIFYYKRGTIRTSGFVAKNDKLYTEKRGIVKKMSQKSRERLALIVAETEVRFKTMATFTYPLRYRITGKEAKDNLNSLLRFIRGRFPCVGYLWFMEFTVKGQVHFHILLSSQVLSLDKAELARFWSYLIAKSATDAEEIFYTHSREGAIEPIRKKDGAIRYALKYALKSGCKEVPMRFHNVGRFWGFNKIVGESVPKPDFIKISEGDFREFLKGQGNPMHTAKRWPLIIFNRQIVSRETIGQKQDNSETVNLTKSD